MEFLLLAFLVLLSAFFSSSETALTAFSKIKLHHLEKKGEPKALIIKELMKNPTTVLGGILVGNNIVNVAAAALGTAIAFRLFEYNPVLIATIFMTFLILFFGEIIPKSYAARNPTRVSYTIVWPLKGVMVLLKPITVVLSAMSRGVLKIFGVKETTKETLVTEEEIKAVIHVGEEEGVLAKAEKEMLHGILEFKDRAVKEIMVPRTDIVALEVSTPIDEIMKTLRECHHSRIPIYEQRMDNVVGVLYARDLIDFWRKEEAVEIRSLLHTPYFVPETEKISQLLQEFRDKKIHIAIVVNEFGGVEGIVTLEDILEEIVGEIQDEYDKEEQKIIPLADDTLLVRAVTNLEEFGERVGVDFSDEKEVESVGGFIIKLLGRLPTTGEELEYKNLHFIVEKVDRNRIRRVKVIIRKNA
jgi:gliding motility-associated protein GldE